MRAYVDSDVLICQLCGDEKATEFLQELAADPDYELWIGALQRAEVAFFVREGDEDPTSLLLSQFKTATIDQRIVDSAAKLYRDWRPSHKLDMHDALLAATVMETGGTVFTLNKKRFPMPDIVVKQAWR
jgi:predicted nucleic acid-binding protein